MYEILEASYQIEGATYTSYGIKHSEGIVADLSLEREPIEALVRLCNLHELHPCHLLEIAQDFVAI